MNKFDSSIADSSTRIAFIVLLGAVAVAGFNIQPIYLGALADHLEFSSEQLGFIASAEIGGSAIAGIAATLWIRLWNWRIVVTIALGALAIGNIASCFFADFGILVAIRFLTGFVGMGTGYALAIAALSNTQNTERNYSIAVVAQVSIAIFGFLALPTIINAYGVVAVFVPLALIALAMLPFVHLLPIGGRVEESGALCDRSVRPAAIWMVLGCQIVWYLGIGGVWAFVERIGANVGINSESIGTALAVGMVVGLAGAFVAAAIADRFGRIIPFASAMLGQVVAVWFLADLSELSGFVIAICLYNGAWNFALPYIFAAAALADTDGKFVVLMQTAQAVGITFGATMAGAAIGRFGLIAVAYQGAVAAFIALGIFLLLGAMAKGVRRS